MAMTLVSDIARLALRIELALTTRILVSDIASEPNVYLVAATDMVDVLEMAIVALAITPAPMVMVLVAVMFTAGSNVPLE
jgi:hypothetical protein